MDHRQAHLDKPDMVPTQCIPLTMVDALPPLDTAVTVWDM